MTVHEPIDALNVGMTRRWWTGYLLVFLAVTVPFALLYQATKMSVLNEIRHHATGVAIAVAAGIDPELFVAIQGPADMETEAYHTLQRQLDRVSTLNPDVLYVYTMRKSDQPFVPMYELMFVVDQSARDLNGDGGISRDEESEPPGARYDSRFSPDMLVGFEQATADQAIRPDPPYPDSMSGYAPIRDDAGHSLGIVGVDISAQTIHAKMRVVQLALFGVWGILLVLAVMLTSMTYRQRDAYEQNRIMGIELSRRNDMLRAANEELARIQESGVVPRDFSDPMRRGLINREDRLSERVVVDQYYLASAHPGGDFCDIFDLDDDRIGVYLAHVAGHGVSAALMAGTLKLCMKLVKGEVPRHAGGTFYANLHRPESLMQSLNHFLRAEMPERDFVTMVYAVIDLVENQMTYVSCGHPDPILLRKDSGKIDVLNQAHHVALGIDESMAFTSGQAEVAVGDRLVLASQGLIGSLNSQGEPLGMDRFLTILSQHAGDSVPALTEAVKAELALHRGGSALLSDYSFLAVEIK